MGEEVGKDVGKDVGEDVGEDVVGKDVCEEVDEDVGEDVVGKDVGEDVGDTSEGKVSHENEQAVAKFGSVNDSSGEQVPARNSGDKDSRKLHVRSDSLKFTSSIHSPAILLAESLRPTGTKTFTIDNFIVINKIILCVIVL